MKEEQIVWDYDDLSEGREIIGEITDLDMEASEEYVTTQIHVQLKPEGYVPKGRTGREHEWYSVSSRKNSKWGYFTKALKDCGVSIPKKSPLSRVRTVLVGKVFRWERKVLSYGMKDEDTSKDKKETWIPLEVISRKKEEGQDFSDLKERLRGGMTETEVFRWGRENRVPKADVQAYVDTLTLVEEDGQLWLDD